MEKDLIKILKSVESIYISLNNSGGEEWTDPEVLNQAAQLRFSLHSSITIFFSESDEYLYMLSRISEILTSQKYTLNESLRPFLSTEDSEVNALRILLLMVTEVMREDHLDLPILREETLPEGTVLSLIGKNMDKRPL